MGKFLESEKKRQADFKVKSSYFSAKARTDGIYNNKHRPFCLPIECAEENLFSEIRKDAIEYFDAYKIKWHDSSKENNLKLSNHLCDSQICCVNFLFPFAKKSHLLADLLRPLYPSLQKMMPIENNQYVVFEWIGLKNYLEEKILKNTKRTRGANFTSTDAAVMFKRIDGKQQMVLIEWKYTESYYSENKKYSKIGTDRTRIYRPFYKKYDCPLDKKVLPSFDALFFEPFYQLMRQQFLAREMEKAREFDNDIVSVLHIAPVRNTDFHRITSPELSGLGETAIDIWKRLVRNHRFISTNTEELFYESLTNKLPDLRTWSDYISKRYSWVQNV